ncbi:MAG: hypothetical protein EOO27_08570, partial [Comamonadaceae bacterium]
MKNLRVSKDVALVVASILLALAPLAAGGIYVYQKHLWAEGLMTQLEPRYARLTGLELQKSELEDIRKRVLQAQTEYVYPASMDVSQAGNAAQQHVREIFAAAGMQISSSQVLQPKDEKGYDRIALKVQAEGELLALQSVFLLMQNHGLEYPHAYARLYSLLSASTVSTKYRARLFSLLDLFLSSAALPAYLVAAFIKKAARLALTCGTPFALFALPFIYNCVKRHPSVAPLLHRLTPVSYTAGAWPAPADPFDENAAAPESANALASSLWEVIALSQHTHAPVATLARALMKEATKAVRGVLVCLVRVRGAWCASRVQRERVLHP